MTIPQIKTRLSMADVLAHYGLRPNRNAHVCCPFHDDRTASMQVYAESGTVYCRAAGCVVSNQSLDVIDFVMHREGCTKREAIVRCKEMIAGMPAAAAAPRPKPARPALAAATRQATLLKAWKRMRTALGESAEAQAYLRSRGLDADALARAGAEVAYHDGRLHVGRGTGKHYAASLASVGLLSEADRGGGKSRKPEYRAFAADSLAFALRDAAGKVESLYLRRVPKPGDRADAGRHYFLRGRSGLWPRYPAAGAERVLVCESVVDAASAIQAGLTSDEHGAWSVLALYGTSGFTREHAAALAGLERLREVCVMLDGDEAGRRATASVCEDVRAVRGSVTITVAALPDGEDANSALVAGGPKALRQAVAEREGVFPGLPPSPDRRRHVSGSGGSEAEAEAPAEPTPTPELDATDPLDIALRTAAAEYRVKGLRTDQVDSLRVTLVARVEGVARAVRLKCDLYDDRECARAVRTLAERLRLSEDAAAADLDALATALERYLRERRAGRESGQAPREVPPPSVAECMKLLRADNVIRRIGYLLGRAGIVGEEANRLLLFVVASSYKMPEPLHALIQGSSGSGKTRLLDVVTRCMPAEDVKRFTRVTDNAFYNQSEGYFTHKLLCLEDLDAIKEDALLAIRELMSRGVLSSSTSVKDERSGAITGGERTVRGPVASLSCTTRGEVYEDNISRCLTVAVDESAGQTRRIIAYQNARAGGHPLGEYAGKAEQEATRAMLADCVRLLRPYEVVNPYASRVKLPEGAHKVRRLNELYQSFVRQVCLLNQFKRTKDERGRLVAEPEDLREASAVLFESIVLKCDELDGSLRQFYERLKAYAPAHDTDVHQREVRRALGVSQAQCSRHFRRLVDLEYLEERHGGNLRRKCYRVAYRDDYERMRGRIREDLERQIDALEQPNTPDTEQSPPNLER